MTGASLRKAMSEHVDFGNTDLMTDASMAYRQMGQEMQSHRHVDHSAHEYVRREGETVISTNHAEGFFSQLKRSLDGTHHHVSTQHLPRYLAEFDFRYSTRKLSDTARLQMMMDNTEGRRLTYRPLTEG